MPIPLAMFSFCHYYYTYTLTDSGIDHYWCVQELLELVQGESSRKMFG